MRKSGFVRIQIVAAVAALSVVAAGVGTAGAQSSGTPGVTSTTWVVSPG